VQQGDLLSKFKVSFAAHRHREIQKAQAATFNQWIKRKKKGAYSYSNNDVLLAKTERTSATWIAHGKAVFNKKYSSAPAVIYHIEPELAAELSLMKCLIIQENLPLEVAESRSHAMRLACQHESSAA
jgi:hypothetical protein